ncbi:UNVERIFIED_CONTAM: hypothetical protein K2H54_052223 [Gekko kuhli]
MVAEKTRETFSLPLYDSCRPGSNFPESCGRNYKTYGLTSWAMAGTALKRLMAEYKQLTLNPPEGIVAGPMNEENFFEWEALIM